MVLGGLFEPYFMAYLLQFGFDTVRPAEVRIGYTGLICNDLGFLYN